MRPSSTFPLTLEASSLFNFCKALPAAPQYNLLPPGQPDPLCGPLQPGLWVTLRQSLTAYSFNEALLLCPFEADQWVVWIPDFGEITLPISQFEL